MNIKDDIMIINDAEIAIGGWLSAALDDPAVCAEIKRDIVAWFTFKDTRSARNVAAKIISGYGKEFASKVIQELEMAL